MPNEVATQPTPAATPAPSANPSPGFGPRNIENKAAVISASTNDIPKIMPWLPFASDAASCPVSRIHALPKSAGEYQRPPRRKLERAAATTAPQCTAGIDRLLRARKWEEDARARTTLSAEARSRLGRK